MSHQVRGDRRRFPVSSCDSPFFKNLMIISESLTTYLHSLEQEPDPFLEEMRAFAKEQEVPIIRREMESLIRILLALLKPERVLEIGTGIAYSSVFMALNGETVREIVTIENYPPRIALARENLTRYHMSYKDRAVIRLLEEDAAKVLKRREGQSAEASCVRSAEGLRKESFDLIFLDGPKGQYLSMLPDLLDLLSKGGVLLADNVLQEGKLAQSRFATPRRERTIHERMREFLWAVKHDPSLDTAVLTVGDGVTVSVKK